MARRKKLGRKYSGSTIFSAKLVCGDCGSFFGSKVWHSTSKYRRGRAEVMTAFIKGLEERIKPIDYFDESVWKLTVEKVTIFHDGRMIFQFVDGTEIEG